MAGYTRYKLRVYDQRLGVWREIQRSWPSQAGAVKYGRKLGKPFQIWEVSSLTRRGHAKRRRVR